MSIFKQEGCILRGDKITPLPGHIARWITGGMGGGEYIPNHERFEKACEAKGLDVSQHLNLERVMGRIQLLILKERKTFSQAFKTVQSQAPSDQKKATYGSSVFGVDERIYGRRSSEIRRFVFSNRTTDAASNQSK